MADITEQIVRDIYSIKLTYNLSHEEWTSFLAGMVGDPAVRGGVSKGQLIASVAKGYDGAARAVAKERVANDEPKK